MREFTLEDIEYRNTLAVGHTPIKIKLNGFKKTLVTGSNGAGKSTILEAITFALFGKPFRGINKAQLINSINKKDMFVKLTMSYNGSRYVIERGQKPTIFTVTKDGEKLDEAASSKDFQSYFEEMIRMNYTSFKQIVVLGTAGYTPFMGLTAPARRTLVEDLLEIGVLAEMDKLNKSYVRDITTSLSVLDAQKSSLEQQVNVYKTTEQKQNEMSKNGIARFEGLYSTALSEIKELKDKLIESSTELAEIVLTEDPTPLLNDILGKMASARTTMESYSKVSKLYKTGGDCPTCLQPLINDSLVHKIDNKITDCTNAIEKLKTVHSEKSDLLKEFREQSNRKQTLASTVSRLKGQIQDLANKAKQLQTHIKNASSELVSYSAEITELESKISVVVEQKTNAVMEKYHRGILTEMLKDSGIKAHILKRYIPLFNKRIKYYLNTIMQADYTFTLDSEFNESITSRGRESFSYASFSQGEKSRIDISLLFTWRDIAEMVSGVKINCLFLDEVFDGSFDAAGIKHVQQIINDLDASIYVISHKDHNPADYSRHLALRKVGRFTMLEGN
ncbi:recombination-related endonuclease [Shewanella phage Thanatos-1]|nr:recombination-related endonuclease [Shewanella phage Thanatos-1]QLA10620.1 recombination-related endonuclease [Shewanella phage Thanatos-2]